jgi:hypothetical protein
LSLVSDRIPFAEAISDPLLLKKRFDTLSLPQQVALKAYYGVPLTTDRELDIWSMFQGAAEFDSLGRVTRVTRVPYVPKEYDQAWLVWGRRSGKTDAFSSFVVVYEALLGGHHEHVGTHQEPVIFFVAQKVEIARSHLNFVRAVLATNPILQKEVSSDTADAIVFRNRIRIEPAAPTIRSTRGLAIPVVVMDEVGFWYTDPEASSPDVEVERALSSAQAQFPHFKRFGTSTPWTKEGLLWKYSQAGTGGWKVRCDDCANSGTRQCSHRDDDREEFKDVLVLHSPTAAIENPRINEKWLRKERARDADAFLRECLAEFVDSISGFLSMPLLMAAVDGGISERRPFNAALDGPREQPFYLAAMDPAFRRDRFAFTIVHHDPERGIVQDLLRVWTPGAGEDRVNPQAVLAEIKPLLDIYGIQVVYSDQYQLESLQQLALGFGFTIEGVDFTGRSKQKIFGSLQQLLNQKRIRLLDKPEMIQELASLERRYLPNGGVQISAPRGRHDDQAAVLAIATFKSVWLLPLVRQQNDEKPPTLFQMGQQTLIRKRSQVGAGWDDY